MGKHSQKYHTVILHCGFSIPLGKWSDRSPKIWQLLYNKEENCIEFMSDKEGFIRYEYEAHRRFTWAQTTPNAEPKGMPATLVAIIGSRLKLFCVSDTQFYEENNLEFLKS